MNKIVKIFGTFSIALFVMVVAYYVHTVLGIGRESINFSIISLCIAIAMGLVIGKILSKK